MDDASSAIRALVENWVLWRDAGEWRRFRTVWHRDGTMSATWFQGPAADFIEASRQAFEAGVNILHVLGGHTADVSGDRAIAQTKMQILQRATIDGAEVDVTCWGRFYDFLVREDGRWLILRRQPIYEKDRLDLVEPTRRLTLEPELLSEFPVGYRHLGYVQTKLGMTVKRDQPGLKGPEVEQLYREGAAWLAEV